MSRIKCEDCIFFSKEDPLLESEEYRYCKLFNITMEGEYDEMDDTYYFSHCCCPYPELVMPILKKIEKVRKKVKRMKKRKKEIDLFFKNKKSALSFKLKVGKEEEDGDIFWWKRKWRDYGSIS